MAEIVKLSSELDAKSNEELLRLLADGLRITAEHLVRLAAVVHKLAERGYDLSSIRLAMMDHLRLIAGGQVLPEIVVRFGAKPSVFSRVQRLPLDAQRLLADGQNVRLLVYAPDGTKTHRMADPMLMTKEQLSQAFASGHLRSEGEQALILDQWTAGKRKIRPERIGAHLRIDKELGGVMVGKKFIPLADLVAAVAALRA